MPVMSYEDLGSNLREAAKGEWLPAKPLTGPFIWELRDRLYQCWEILRGRAVAVRWY